MADRYVLDTGSSTVKFGAAEELLPSVIVPTVTVKKAPRRNLLKRQQAADDSSGPQTVVGHEAIASIQEGAAGLTVTRPMQRGKVTDWDVFEHILNHCFQEADADVEGAAVVIPVPAYSPRETSERLAQSLFESFMVEAVAFVPQGLCALYAGGRTTGCVLESGHGVTTVTNVYDSYVLPRGTNRMNFGGADVSEHLKRLLFEQGLNFTSEVDALTLDAAKESRGCVALDYPAALAAAGPSGTNEVNGEGGVPAEGEPFELPDGSTLTLAAARFRAPEILFQPTVLQLEHPPLPVFVAESIKQCPVDTRSALSSHIVLGGGNTLFDGMAARVKAEVAMHFPGLFGSIGVTADADRRFGAWAGASVLAGMSSFDDRFISRDDYDEHGPTVVHDDHFSRRADAAADE